MSGSFVLNELERLVRVARILLYELIEVDVLTNCDDLHLPESPVSLLLVNSFLFFFLLECATYEGFAWLKACLVF